MKKVNKPLSWLFLTLFIALCFGCASHEKKAPDTTSPSYGKATQRPYKINGHTYYPLPSAIGYSETGIASWYGPKFHGRKTANGERYDMYAMTAAHKTLPMDTLVKVENLENGKWIVVRINDRGPFVKNRIIDLSHAGASKLDMLKRGTARVRVTALGEVASFKKGNPSFTKVPDLKHGQFYVQVGSFQRPENAYKLRAKLAKEYEKVVVVRHQTPTGPMYRVQIYASNNLGKANRLVQQLEKRGFFGAFLIAR